MISEEKMQRVAGALHAGWCAYHIRADSAPYLHPLDLRSVDVSRTAFKDLPTSESKLVCGIARDLLRHVQHTTTSVPAVRTEIMAYPAIAPGGTLVSLLDELAAKFHSRWVYRTQKLCDAMMMEVMMSGNVRAMDALHGRLPPHLNKPFEELDEADQALPHAVIAALLQCLRAEKTGGGERRRLSYQPKRRPSSTRMLSTTAEEPLKAEVAAPRRLKSRPSSANVAKMLGTDDERQRARLGVGPTITKTPRGSIDMGAADVLQQALAMMERREAPIEPPSPHSELERVKKKVTRGLQRVESSVRLAVPRRMGRASSMRAVVEKKKPYDRARKARSATGVYQTPRAAVAAPPLPPKLPPRRDSFRSALHEGWLHKRGAGRIFNGERARFFVLTPRTGALRYFKTCPAEDVLLDAAAQDESTGSQPVFGELGAIIVSSASTNCIATGDATFEVRTPGRVYTLRAPSAKLAKGWLEACALCVERGGGAHPARGGKGGAGREVVHGQL